MEQYTQPPAANPMDPLMATNVGYIPQRNPDVESMMSKHLNSSEMIERLKNMLMGMEYNDEEDEWQPAMIIVGYDAEGKEVKQPEGPLMDPKEIRVLIGSLSMYLDPNTFLSKFKEERINDIMFSVCVNLYCKLGYLLKHKISSSARDLIFAGIEHSILSALNRADNKITLDAISKSQQTHEIIQGGPQKPQQDKEFKVLGW